MHAAPAAVQEESKVAALSQRLEELGVDVGALLEAVAAEAAAAEAAGADGEDDVL